MSIGKITSRERDVLQEISHGRNNRQTALALNISEPTVQRHLENARYKLFAANRVEAVAIALRIGVIQ